MSFENLSAEVLEEFAELAGTKISWNEQARFSYREGLVVGAIRREGFAKRAAAVEVSRRWIAKAREDPVMSILLKARRAEEKRRYIKKLKADPVRNGRESARSRRYQESRRRAEGAVPWKCRLPELVAWVGAFDVVRVVDVVERFGLSRCQAARRLKAVADLGVVVRIGRGIYRRA